MGRYKRYDPAFKESAIQQALTGGRPYIEIARDLGLDYRTFHQWIRKYQKEHMEEKVQVKETLEEENKRLKKENDRLRMEREILKKATAFFASESKRDTNS